MDEMTCVCLEEVIDDGYGELIHADTLRYGCKFVPRNESRYPVATLAVDDRA